jgi:CubicO group peptidase (beta-lactamase class C family)
MQRTMTARLGMALVAVGLLAGACSGSGGSGGSDQTGGSGSDAQSEEAAAAEPAGADRDGAVYPGDEWERVDPAEAGFDPARLEDAAARAEQSGSNCLVVTRRGRLVGEWYWNGSDATTTQEVFSATKSYGSTLVGIAEAAGDLDIDDPASQYIPEWQGTPSEDVTVRNLLSNDSGRHWDAATDYGVLPFEQDTTAFGVGLEQQEEPGSAWAYNNAAIQTLDAVLEAATGEEPADYARDRLLGPIGMDHSEMGRDPAGNTLIFMGLRSTCQDMARFGYLFLRDGAWDGEQVVSEEWVEEATGHPSQDLTAGYGLLWWLNRRGPILGPLAATGGAAEAADRQPAEGQMVEGAPEDMYWALGLGGQVISIDPGSETVVVRLGPPRPPEGAPGYGPGEAARIVTDALTDPHA